MGSRILTYGYSPELFTGLRGKQSTQLVNERALVYLPQALYLHSNRLLEALARLRASNAENRPVVFIAHSLGGLIVKTALINASAAIHERDCPLKAIQLLTIGVIFLGTPHRASRSEEWSNMLIKNFHATNPTSSIGFIQPLFDKARSLDLQIEQYKSIESNFFNYSFYEGPRRHNKGRDGKAVGLKAEQT